MNGQEYRDKLNVLDKRLKVIRKVYPRDSKTPIQELLLLYILLDFLKFDIMYHDYEEIIQKADIDYYHQRQLIELTEVVKRLTKEKEQISLIGAKDKYKFFPSPCENYGPAFCQGRNCNQCEFKRILVSLY